ncbi:MAG: superoxide dismutase family protein [Rhodobacteraceae bacterium]|nr:superoxide dismutase family protein [Paracoccaceae bacterium]
MKSFSLALLVGIGLASAAVAATPLTTPALNNQGAEIGQITFTPAKTGILIRISLKPGALPPGWHGMHLHAVGDCGDIAAFKNAKAHVTHGKGMHGLLNAEGPEDGDLPNLHAAADGSAEAEVFTRTVGLSDGPSMLLDQDGSALVIHTDEDDQMSQPIGNSGVRLVCAVLK